MEMALGINMKMVYVSGGSFTMGATPEQGSDAYDDEKPAHQVSLSGYYIGAYEVTQGQWEKVMGSNPSSFKKGDNYPVENVSWEDAQAFCRELIRRTSKRYVLPTEAQWEYAARGGNRNERAKYSGSDVVDVVAWYDGNSGSSTHPVGTKRSNALGLYDMSGNVREWCADWFDSSYYSSSPTMYPAGPSSGSYRVARGGSWYSYARYCRVSHRAAIFRAIGTSISASAWCVFLSFRQSFFLLYSANDRRMMKYAGVNGVKQMAYGMMLRPLPEKKPKIKI